MFERLFFDLSLLFAKASFIVFITKILIFVILVLAIIGLISTIKFLARRRSLKKETDAQYFMRTGRLREKK